MTDIKLLMLLSDYSRANRDLVNFLIWAMEDFERGREQHSWNWLIEWCEAKDEREALWKQIQPHYVDAVMLKEGVSRD